MITIELATFIFLLVSILIIWEEMSLEPVAGTIHTIMIHTIMVRIIMIHTTLAHTILIHTLIIFIIMRVVQEIDHEATTKIIPEAAR